MSNAKRKFTPREKSYLSEFTLGMQGPVQNGAQFPAEFRMAFAANKVAIQVETKNRDAKNFGRFEVVVPYMSAIGILNTIDLLIQDKNRSKAQYRVKDFVFFGPGNKSDAPMLKGTLTVGRDTEGCLYIGLSGKDITPIKFIFSLKHDELTNDQGEPVNAAEMAEFAAKVFVETYKGLLPVVMALHYKEPEPKNPAGGNGGQQGGGNSYGGGRGNGGGNNNYGGNRNNAPAPKDFDDDIPF